MSDGPEVRGHVIRASDSVRRARLKTGTDQVHGTHTRSRTHALTHTCMHTHSHTDTRTHTKTHTHTHAHVCTRIHTRTHAHTQKHTRTHTHAHTHTHINIALTRFPLYQNISSKDIRRLNSQNIQTQIDHFFTKYKKTKTDQSR